MKINLSCQVILDNLIAINNTITQHNDSLS
jgi:hypothetical protein